ncbi:unnamed protein product, partial [marine sediment metagenome]
AKEISDKFIIKKRSLKECREPWWIYVDDLKRPDSRIPIYSFPRAARMNLDEISKSALIVSLSANNPLETADEIDSLIEKYFEDDIAELAYLVYRIEPHIWMRHPEQPQYLMPFLHFFHTRRRQNHPILYRITGTLIGSYQWTDMGRTTYMEIPPEHGISIHNKDDLELAKFYLEKRQKKNLA